MSKNDESYIVICLALGDRETGVLGAYALATPQVFTSPGDAAAFAVAISRDRAPLVVPGDFYALHSAPTADRWLPIEMVAQARFPGGDLQHEGHLDVDWILAAGGYDVAQLQHHLDRLLEIRKLPRGAFAVRRDGNDVHLHFSNEKVCISEFVGCRKASEVLDALESLSKGCTAAEAWAAVKGDAQ